MNLPETVTVIEVATRDGFQVESKPIPTHLKVETIDALAEAGVRRIQVTSFVHPKWVPQLADADEVCRSISRKPGVTYSALALNKKGVERAHAAGINHLDLSISVSDTHSRKNTNVPLPEAMKNLREMIDLAGQEKMELRVGIGLLSTWNPSRVATSITVTVSGRFIAHRNTKCAKRVITKSET